MTKGRLTRAGFKYDVVIGEDAERRWLVTTEATAEVKSDKRVQETGNIFVEYRQDVRGEGIWMPSGISVTEARYWVEEFDVDCWLATPVDRIKFLVSHFGRRGRKVLGGDFNHHKGVLIPVSAIVYPKAHGIDMDGRES